MAGRIHTYKHDQFRYFYFVLMLRTPHGVFALRPCTRVLMESNLECSSSTETSTDSGTLSGASRIERKLKQNRSTLWASGQSITGKNKSIMCKTLLTCTCNYKTMWPTIVKLISLNCPLFCYSASCQRNCLTLLIWLATNC